MAKFKSLNNHWTNKHGVMRPKKQFDTLQDALGYMDAHNINKLIYNPYVCVDCGLWHIGHRKPKTMACNP